MSSQSETPLLLVSDATTAETDLRWKDFIEAMERIAIKETIWSAHIKEMRRVRANVVGRQVLHKVSNFIEPIIQTGKGPPIYFIHSLLGTGTEVLDLADMLGPGYQLFSVRPPTAYHNAIFPSSIESIAKQYVEELRKNQTSGSLILIGRSAGVVIALHMRELLIGLDYDVRLLVALDFAPYGTGADVGPFDFRYNYCRIRNWTRQFYNESKISTSYASLILGVCRELGKRASQECVKLAKEPDARISGIKIPEFFTDDERKFVFVLNAAMSKYRYTPSVVSRKKLRVLAYVSTKEPDRSLYNVEAKWRKITENVEFVSICGTHRDIVERPNVSVLANHLRCRLDELSGY